MFKPAHEVFGVYGPIDELCGTQGRSLSTHTAELVSRLPALQTLRLEVGPPRDQVCTAAHVIDVPALVRACAGVSLR